MSLLATQFDGIILHSAESPSDSILPFAFDGIVISFSNDSIFLTIKNGLGKPVSGVILETVFNGNLIQSISDQNGLAIIEVNDTATIVLKKDKTFRTKSYVRASEGNIVNYVYHVPMME
jgi:hypothetical protein